MTKLTRQNFLYMLLTAIIFTSGYLYLRYAYYVAEPLPFAQEIVLVVLGTLATILITAILLNKQTEVELTKEQSIKFIELKSALYTELLNYLEELFHRPRIRGDDIIKLQFLTHKLAISASHDVLHQYQQLLQIFAESAKDHQFSHRERDDLHAALAHLTVKIRQDLVGDIDEQADLTASEVEHQVLQNCDLTLSAYDNYELPKDPPNDARHRSQ